MCKALGLIEVHGDYPTSISNIWIKIKLTQVDSPHSVLIHCKWDMSKLITNDSTRVIYDIIRFLRAAQVLKNSNPHEFFISLNRVGCQGTPVACGNHRHMHMHKCKVPYARSTIHSKYLFNIDDNDHGSDLFDRVSSMCWSAALPDATDTTGCARCGVRATATSCGPYLFTFYLLPLGNTFVNSASVTVATISRKNSMGETCLGPQRCIVPCACRALVRLWTGIVKPTQTQKNRIRAQLSVTNILMPARCK